MTTVRRLLPAALVLLWAGTLHAQAGRLRSAWTSPCTLSVVLVAFKDTNGDVGLVDNYCALVPGTSSYTMDDFKRLFSGGYHYSVHDEAPELIPAYTGTPTVADNNDGVSETLPEVFGSLRHYFHEVSGGAFELHVRTGQLAPQGPAPVPRPPQGYYAHRFIRW